MKLLCFNKVTFETLPAEKVCGGDDLLWIEGVVTQEGVHETEFYKYTEAPKIYPDHIERRAQKLIEQHACVKFVGKADIYGANLSGLGNFEDSSPRGLKIKIMEVLMKNEKDQGIMS